MIVLVLKSKINFDDLEQVKKFLLELLESNNVEKSKALPVGTVRDWQGKKYRKIDKKKWRRQFEGDSRGAKQSSAFIKKQIEKAQNIHELAEIIKKNRNRFKDENGKPHKIVEEFLNHAKGIRGEKPKIQKVDKGLSGEYSNDVKIQTVTFTNGNKGFQFKLPYNADFISKIKEIFNPKERSWNNEKKAWYIYNAGNYNEERTKEIEQKAIKMMNELGLVKKGNIEYEKKQEEMKKKELEKKEKFSKFFTDYKKSENGVEIEFPSGWNHYKKEYVAIVNINNEGNIDRDFIGNRTHFSSSGKNADIEYYESDKPENIKVGTLVEIKDGSYKNMRFNIYRKDENGWKLLVSRLGSSYYFDGNRENLKKLIYDKIESEGL